MLIGNRPVSTRALRTRRSTELTRSTPPCNGAVTHRPISTDSFTLRFAPKGHCQIVSIVRGRLVARSRSDICDRGNFSHSSIDFVTMLRHCKRQLTPTYNLLNNFKLGRNTLTTAIDRSDRGVIIVNHDTRRVTLTIGRIVRSNNKLYIMHGNRIRDRLPLPVTNLVDASATRSLTRRVSTLGTTTHRYNPLPSRPFVRVTFLSLPIVPTLGLADRKLFSNRGFTFAALRIARWWGDPTSYQTGIADCICTAIGY